MHTDKKEFLAFRAHKFTSFGLDFFLFFLFYLTKCENCSRSSVGVVELALQWNFRDGTKPKKIINERGIRTDEQRTTPLADGRLKSKTINGRRRSPYSFRQKPRSHHVAVRKVIK